MQSVGRSLRSVGTARRAIQPAQIASTSCAVQWDARRHATFGNPLEWVQKKLQPAIREKNTEEELALARQEQADKGQLGIFDSVETTPSAQPWIPQEPPKKGTHHKYSTANFKMSHRKLNDLGRQIAGKPINHAILQMRFSEKRASTRLTGMLAIAKQHATLYKGLDESKLIVAEAWVTKGPKTHKRLDIKGRGRHGIRIHPDSRMHVVLKEGKTWQEKAQEDRARVLKRIKSAGIVREDVPLRNPAPMWAW